MEATKACMAIAAIVVRVQHGLLHALDAETEEEVRQRVFTVYSEMRAIGAKMDATAERQQRQLSGEVSDA